MRIETKVYLVKETNRGITEYTHTVWLSRAEAAAEVGRLEEAYGTETIWFYYEEYTLFGTITA